MNKQRAKKIEKIREKLSGLMDALEELSVEESDYQDAIPENLQDSSKAEDSRQCLDNMESACSSLSDACDYLEQIELTPCN